MATKVTYSKLLDEYKPSLEILGDLEYSEKTPISHLLDIAENLKKIEEKAEAFWEMREKLLQPFVEKDEDGKNKTKAGVNPITKESTTEFVLTEENRIAWQAKFEELRKTEVSVSLNKLDKKHFEGAKGLKVSYLRGIFDLLK